MSAFYIFASCFCASLGTSVLWRLLTQLTPHPEADQEVEDQIANGMTVVASDPFHSTDLAQERQRNHG